MVKKVYEVEYDDGLYMADAKGSPGGKRGLLFDDEGLHGQAVFYELSDEELKERYGAATTREERELTPEEREFYDRLAEIAVACIALAITKAVPHIKDAVQNVVVPKGRKFFKGVRSKLAKVAESKKKSPARDRNPGDLGTSAAEDTIAGQQTFELRAGCAAQNHASGQKTKDGARLISSDEANERIARAMFLAQALADECDYLKRCRVKDGAGEAGQLVGNDKLLDYFRLVLDGETRCLPRNTTIEFLRLLGSERVSSEIAELPLPNKDSYNRQHWKDEGGCS